MKKYYSLSVSKSEADIYIFGDIVEPTTQEIWGMPADTSGFSLVQEIKNLDVETINVHINSYGGHTSEGLAIYNILKNHKAKIVTYNDGFACSAASIVFMAGDERIMSIASLLMIHNAWNVVQGNANQLRKEADDLDTISETAANTYMTAININREELNTMLDAETWITPQEALEMGFATSLINEPAASKVSQNVRRSVFSKVINTQGGIVLFGGTPKIITGSSGQPEQDPSQENKPMKFLNALFGGKEG